MKKKIYLDYAASTPVDSRVLEAMMPYLREEYGNPSSTHSFGQKARAAIEQARVQVAGFLHCSADEVIFTSGATEANNLAIQGVVKGAPGKPHIVTTAIEHESVLEPCRELEKSGLAEVTYAKPQKDGIVRAQDIKGAIKGSTVLVSVQYANSEIGTIQPVQEIGEFIRRTRSNKKGPYPVFHSDAVQAANFLDCNVDSSKTDLVTLSGHKMYGPKGVGVLYSKRKTALAALAVGGGQEMGARSGTENVAAIVGFGAAIASGGGEKEARRIRQLRDKLAAEVREAIPDTKLTGSREKRLPNNAHFRFSGVQGRDVVLLLDREGIAVSSGSACSEKTQEPSHVLLALGLSKKEALSALRVTLGKQTKPEDIAYTVRALSRVVAQLRKRSV